MVVNYNQFWRYCLKVDRIVSNLLDSNTYIITKDDQVLIIDAGVEIEKIKTVVGNKKVCGVLLTHAHYDHSLNAQKYADEFNCKIFISKQAKETLSDPNVNYSEGRLVVTNFSTYVVVEDLQEIQLGNFKVFVIKTQGHSKCSVCYLIGQNLFAGDTLFDRGIGRTDLIGSDKQEMLNSLEKLENLQYQICFSGHGQSSTKEEQEKNILVFKKFLNRS